MSKNKVISAKAISDDLKSFLGEIEYDGEKYLVVMDQDGVAITDAQPIEKFNVGGPALAYKLDGKSVYVSGGTKPVKVNMEDGRIELGVKAPNTPKVETSIQVTPTEDPKTKRLQYTYNGRVFKLPDYLDPEPVTLIKDDKNHIILANDSYIYMEGNGRQRWIHEKIDLSNVKDIQVTKDSIVAVGQYGHRSIVDKKTGVGVDFSMETTDNTPDITLVGVDNNVLVTKDSEKFWLTQFEEGGLQKPITYPLLTDAVALSYNAAHAGRPRAEVANVTTMTRLFELGRNESAVKILMALPQKDLESLRTGVKLYSEVGKNMVEINTKSKQLPLDTEAVEWNNVDPKQIKQELKQNNEISR